MVEPDNSLRLCNTVEVVENLWVHGEITGLGLHGWDKLATVASELLMCLFSSLKSNK